MASTTGEGASRQPRPRVPRHHNFWYNTPNVANNEKDSRMGGVWGSDGCPGLVWPAAGAGERAGACAQGRGDRVRGRDDGEDGRVQPADGICRARRAGGGHRHPAADRRLHQEGLLCRGREGRRWRPPLRDRPGAVRRLPQPALFRGAERRGEGRGGQGGPGARRALLPPPGRSGRPRHHGDRAGQRGDGAFVRQGHAQLRRRRRRAGEGGRRHR